MAFACCFAYTKAAASFEDSYSLGLGTTFILMEPLSVVIILEAQLVVVILMELHN